MLRKIIVVRNGENIFSENNSQEIEYSTMQNRKATKYEHHPKRDVVLKASGETFNHSYVIFAWINYRALQTVILIVCQINGTKMHTKFNKTRRLYISKNYIKTDRVTRKRVTYELLRESLLVALCHCRKNK